MDCVEETGLDAERLAVQSFEQLGGERCFEEDAFMSLRAIAHQAGVSISAVSLALNPRTAHRISDETRRRIEDVAQAVGYQPNRAAQSLKTGRYHTVGVWTADLANPISGLVLSYLHVRIGKAGYEMVIRAGEALNEQSVSRWAVDGVLAISGGYHIDDYLCNRSSTLPFVDFGAFHSDLCDFVALDITGGTAQAIAHLYETGRRRIGMLIAELNYVWQDPRRAAYSEALRSHGLEPVFVLSGENNREGAGAALREFLGRGGTVDALFCMDDMLAIGANRALREMGLRVPQDVALVGFDGIEETEYHAPPITTVVQPFQEMADLGWQFLRNRIERPDLPRQQAVLTPLLAVRGSSLSATG